jgi:hypothetical protein
MIEHMQAMRLVPGRAWALSVGRLLTFPKPDHPQKRYKWRNHVAPTVAVTGADDGVLVIDPSLSQTGPLTLTAWAGIMGASSVEISTAGLSQSEILGRQSSRAIQGKDLDAVLFSLKLGEPPIPEVGGSGFRVDPDPAEGPSAYAHEMMKLFLDNQRRFRPERP